MVGADQLDAMIERLRGFRGIADEAAREAAPLVEKAARASAAAGTTPEGKPWPGKKSGGRALEHAAAHITAEAVGSAVVVTLRGPDVWHHQGTARVPERKIIPRTGDPLPPAYAEAMAEGARRAFARRAG